jgi:hypothetical protein
MMLNPWIFGLESVQQGWQAQSAMACRLMRLFGGGVPDQTTSSLLIQDTVAVETKAEEEAPAAIADEHDAPAAIADKQEAPAAIVDARPLKAPKGFAGQKKGISRETPERIKTGGRS